MSETAKCIRCDKTKAEHTDNPLDFSNCGDWEPAVTAQEAPRCFGCDKSLTYCDCHYPQVSEPQAVAPRCDCHKFTQQVCDICQGVTGNETDFEPQAGAQVPSRDEYRYKTSEEAELLPLPLQILRLKEINAGLCNSHNTLLIMNARAEAHLNSIKSYAVEAAKTPITREDMHDPLKAQTFYDEAKGFERLVLSETGGAK